MFAHAYFASAYFAPAYFPPAAGAAADYFPTLLAAQAEDLSLSSLMARMEDL